MRHFHHIYLYLCLVLALLSSCMKEALVDLSREVYKGDGSVVDVTLPFGSAESISVTKALSDESERQVNDLLVLAFPVSGVDMGGNPIFDGTKPVFKQYFSKSELSAANPQAGHYNAGVVPVNNLPTGTYVFEGVANVLSSEYSNDDLYADLMAVDSWIAYVNARTSLNTKGSVDRIAPSMLMSGTYRELTYAGDHDTRLPVTVSSAGQLSGYIHLVRADARVRFVITNNVSRVKSFKLESWQVFNVPDDVQIYSKSGSTPLTVSNSSAFSSFTSRNIEHSFEFYIPEYVFTSSDGALDMIRKREKRNSLDTEWLYAPQNAPYVVFTGKMEMLVDDAETGETDVNRYADVKFIVHLGACDGADEAEKAKDFKTDRNTKYTYNITINGVNDVVVEAKKESVEYNHGVEGVVIDNVGGVTFNFDSHYGIANIALSKNDLKKMSITLSSVVGEQHYNRDNAGNLISQNLNTGSEDFQAFRFAFEPASSVLAYQNYPAQIFREKFVSYSDTYDAGKYIEVLHNEVAQVKDANHTAAMYDLRSMLECLPFGDGEAAYKDQALIDHLDAAEAYRAAHPGPNQYASREDIPIIFTVFVNENVYYNDVSDWHAHANSVDRILRMFTSAAISTDGKSEYIRGRYNFDQKYCQTYYSDLNQEALCVEFVNEHHHKDIKNTKGTNPGKGKSVKSGWQYVNAELGGKNWNDCSDQTLPLCDHYNAFSTLYATNGVYAKQIPGSTDSNDYEAVYASLSRNRDLNRNGVIESNELKWFLASMEQYIQITIGGAALSRKIFSPDDYNNWNVSVDGPKGDIFGNVRFHYCGVEMQSKFWSEEGYTVGDQWVNKAAETSAGWASNPWELLCCRMLVDHSRIGSEETYWNDFDDLYYFSNRSKNVIAMDKYRSNLHRQAVVGWIDLHENSNDAANSTFTHFQFAKNDAAIIDKNPGELVLVDRMHRNTYCEDYYEEADASDRGTWRIPNQRETAVMRYLAGINNATQPNGGAYYLSSSIWPFPSSGQRNNAGYQEVIDFCTVGMNPTKSSPNGQLRTENLRVRCVRDTDQDGNFVGRPEFGNPVNFVPGAFNCTYGAGDVADFTVGATMDAALVSSVSVTIDGYPASTTGSGSISSTVTGASVRAKQVTAVWTIVTTSGKTLNYRQLYDLPARYWMISRYGVDRRYATVNETTGNTLMTPEYHGDLDEAPAIDKWIITTSSVSPVNEQTLSTGVTYYFMNAGTQNFISGPTGGSQSSMPTGAVPVPIQLQTRSGYDGYYVIRINNSTNANSNGGVGNFGTWTGVDDGSTYKLTPVVMRGEMPLQFSFDENIIENPGTYSVHITTDAAAVPVTVTIDGKAAVVTGSAGNYTATINGPVSGAEVVTSWVMSYNGSNITKTKTYSIPAKYWVISRYSRDNRYASVDSETGRTRSNQLFAGSVEDLDAEYKWIITRSTGVVVNESELQTGVTYYLYNVGAADFINGPKSGSSFLTVGADPMSFELVATSTAPYYFIRFNNTNLYANRNGGDADCFGIVQNNNPDSGSWYKFTPVLNRGDLPLNFKFGANIESLEPGYRVTATMAEDAVVESVTIDGKNAVVSGSAGSYTAQISVPVSNVYSIPVVWTIRHNGETYTKTRTYSAVAYWAFRDRDNNSKAVTVSGGLTVLRTESLDDRALPDDCKWLLLLPGDETRTNQTPTLPTNGSYMSQKYILYNIGTGLYLGTSTSGTNNANNFTMVSDPAQALQFDLGGNNNGALWRVNIGGATGYFDRRTDWSLGVNGGLRHAWYFRLVN